MAQPFRWAFNDGQKPVSQWSFHNLAGLAAGASSSQQFDFPAGRPVDNYTFRVDADWDGVIDEWVETNNHKLKLMVIGWCKGDSCPTPDDTEELR